MDLLQSKITFFKNTSTHYWTHWVYLCHRVKQQKYYFHSDTNFMGSWDGPKLQHCLQQSFWFNEKNINKNECSLPNNKSSYSVAKCQLMESWRLPGLFPNGRNNQRTKWPVSLDDLRTRDFHFQHARNCLGSCRCIYFWAGADLQI